MSGVEIIKLVIDSICQHGNENPENDKLVNKTLEAQLQQTE